MHYFQDGADAILDFLNFNRVELSHRAKFVKIPLEQRSRYNDFLFFKMAAAAMLDFRNFKILTVVAVHRVDLRHRVKFRRNRSNRGRDMAIFEFFKLAAAAILDYRLHL